jgi:hypothetical protein
MRDEIAAVRVVEIEPAHDRETIGVFAYRLDRELVRIRVPQHRVDQCPVDAGLIHPRDRLLRRIRFLAMVRGRRALFPEMDLSVDDQHGVFLPRDAIRRLRQRLSSSAAATDFYVRR